MPSYYSKNSKKWLELNKQTALSLTHVNRHSFRIIIFFYFSRYPLFSVNFLPCPVVLLNLSPRVSAQLVSVVIEIVDCFFIRR